MLRFTSSKSVTEVSRSKWYYFSRGDIVIHIDNRLYKLHRDILEIHSGFFRDMFATPSSDSLEGTTEENPLYLAQELCPSESFGTLCEFMYPKKPGALPVILSKDFSVWEPVLQATSALDMVDIQEYILDQLAADVTSLPSSPEGLLHWAIRCSHQALTVAILRFFAYRRLPLSPEEVITLGEHTARVMFVRERVRTKFLSSSSRLVHDISPHNMCTKRTECRQIVIEAISHNMTCSLSNIPKGDPTDIFQVSPKRLCARCQPIRLEMAHIIRKGELDAVVTQSAEGHVPSHQ